MQTVQGPCALSDGEPGAVCRYGDAVPLCLPQLSSMRLLQRVKASAPQACAMQGAPQPLAAPNADQALGCPPALPPAAGKRAAACALGNQPAEKRARADSRHAAVPLAGGEHAAKSPRARRPAEKRTLDADRAGASCVAAQPPAGQPVSKRAKGQASASTQQAPAAATAPLPAEQGRPAAHCPPSVLPGPGHPGGAAPQPAALHLLQPVRRLQLRLKGGWTAVLPERRKHWRAVHAVMRANRWTCTRNARDLFVFGTKFELMARSEGGMVEGLADTVMQLHLCVGRHEEEARARYELRCGLPQRDPSLVVLPPVAPPLPGALRLLCYMHTRVHPCSMCASTS